MRCHRLLLLLATLPLLLAASPKKQDLRTRSLISGGQMRSYYLQVPKNLLPQGPVPLLVVLHGSGARGKVLAEAWARLAQREGFVVVAPSSKNPRYWQVPVDGPAFLRDLVETLKRSYPIDPRRVYLFGHSSGASFALQMSMLESQYFAGAALHAGAWEEDGFRMMDRAKRKIPLHITIGTADEIFPLQRVRRTRDALQERGFPIRYVELRSHTHDYFEMAPSINRQAWAFLEQQRLTEEPSYQEHRFLVEPPAPPPPSPPTP